ncbi:saccharopine dehydrogenase C-terminal domain-containing protein [Neolewinella lacunae]|uniref:Saccharopine dehydrogenase NADP-binding domain-containing protein n=1 Tax=Neolewinella lacunae TaxID=1517758 RepID=A0A923PGF7_9BACT|nr:saccharopine dehydrogenase C-terminal domain-containing protein [Neolewinella lacunae]MBC6993615.1 saccharopine dehydrogenase NADP-binding domain-containing protein [Neolewinella lacunae]MDN3635521.1 saccharopine dehydrogenase C-terminal domain-containing protein [Neolewinella lacunae]
MSARILIIGAGRSSSALINYALQKSTELGWSVTVADADPSAAAAKIKDHPRGHAAWLDVTKTNDRRDLIDRADIVVSLLPAHLHIEVAQDCIRLKKHLITASYVSQELYRLGDEARNRELIFMGEMGLDPGIDHMTAMQRINEIREKGGKITAFYSFTGGLVAPENNDNPWGYKFTWNPRNVVLAGQGTAQYLYNGKLKFLPYQRLFRTTWDVEVPGLGKFEAYANRDSLLYRHQYGLHDIPTILRGTLRYPGFCAAWSALVRIGLTNADFPILDSDKITYHELMEALAPSGPGSVRDRIAQMLKIDVNGEAMERLNWLGLFRKKKINLPDATPALILEDLLLEKWKLGPKDKDLIVMQHQIEYELDGKKYRDVSNLTMKGENAEDTAMSRLVGLPMGIFTRLISQGMIKATGVHIPTMREVYEPVLEEMKEYGMELTHETQLI